MPKRKVPVVSESDSDSSEPVPAPRKRVKRPAVKKNEHLLREQVELINPHPKSIKLPVDSSGEPIARLPTFKAEESSSAPLAVTLSSASASPLLEPSGERDMPTCSFLTWNVAGLRACLKKNFEQELLRCSADIVCLNEVKWNEATSDSMPDAVRQMYPWMHFHSAEKKGYAGSAIFSRIEPVHTVNGVGVDSDGQPIDTEGRVITSYFLCTRGPNARPYPLVVVCCYTPNSGDGLKRLDFRIEEWDPALRAWLSTGVLTHMPQQLKAALQPDESPFLIVTGDLNCAHLDIDLFSPSTNVRFFWGPDANRFSLIQLRSTAKICWIHRSGTRILH